MLGLEVTFEAHDDDYGRATYLYWCGPDIDEYEAPDDREEPQRSLKCPHNRVGGRQQCQ